ncbi:MAG: signal peptide peptidase SppA [Cyclobacteriaceae bacterium]
MAFLRNLLATLLGLFIFCIFGFFILVGIIGVASSSEGVPDVKSNSVLSINLSGVLVERTIDDPLAQALGNGPSQLGIMDALDAIHAAKEDDRIKGIYIEPMFMQAGQASLLEIRDALIDFKTSGKFIYAYGEYISESDYLVASVADTLLLNPEGYLEFNGLNISVTFFKGLFDKLDIEPEIFRVGEFKSYVEPFIRKSLSEENELQLRELLESMQSTYLMNVAENTNSDFSTLKNISDKMLAWEPQDAEKVGLVTRVGYEDEIKSIIRTAIDISSDDDINFITLKKYAKTLTGEYSSNKIAVIVADGDIVFGSADDAVGGDQFADEIRKARESSSVKAIVLRINSPGGSMTASEQIWREIMLTKGVKPVIASMSNVAASGGYYIAAPCDTIIAQPNTVTGSIGIFSILYNFGDFLDNKLGITNDVVKTGEYSDIFTVTRSLNQQERAIIQRRVENGYDTFIGRVAQGRNMSAEDVKKVAGGRVWTGAQAFEFGLVDMLGSYEDAIELAAIKAGVVDDYRIRFYPEQKEFLEKIMENLEDVSAGEFLGKENILTPYLKKIESLERMQGLQARMPGDLTVQ